MSFNTNALDSYSKVVKISGKLIPPNIPVYTPSITNRDRQHGEIVRYFARFTTHTSIVDILEVSKTTWSTLKSNSLYNTISIRWKISGPLEDVGLPNSSPPIRLYTGVLTANRLSVQFASEQMPGIEQYLTDYKRFWEE